MAQTSHSKWRNIFIFVIGVLIIGNLAGIYFHAADGLGGLVFILSPVVMALALRGFAGDGWGEIGLNLGRGRVETSYTIAALLFPVVLAATVGFGLMSGQVSVTSDGLSTYLGLIAATAVPIILFAFCEEFGWRGYLDPKLADLGVSLPGRAGIVGMVWVLWHIGYIHANPDLFSTLPKLVFWPLMITSTFAMAVIYAVLRERTRSIWPAVIAHALANILTRPLVSDPVLDVNAPLIFAPRPEGLIMWVSLALVATLVWRWHQSVETRSTSPAVNSTKP
ncbi:CPBP family intramembrane glutamic endopeptidase [Celeribacter arenosi]|uniref:CAAX prenyl protease 2/Lysostaphin resistance protein A-like domain-containing protein n=1 Tax=Celeribacter arenosi TaxID=792649 RepID=A0ABP7KFG9_9RHOB